MFFHSYLRIQALQRWSWVLKKKRKKKISTVIRKMLRYSSLFLLCVRLSWIYSIHYIKIPVYNIHNKKILQNFCKNLKHINNFSIPKVCCCYRDTTSTGEFFTERATSANRFIHPESLFVSRVFIPFSCSRERERKRKIARVVALYGGSLLFSNNTPYIRGPEDARRGRGRYISSGRETFPPPYFAFRSSELNSLLHVSARNGARLYRSTPRVSK